MHKIIDDLFISEKKILSVVNIENMLGYVNRHVDHTLKNTSSRKFKE